MKCKNCHHPIKKIKGVYKHQIGGTYCKVKWCNGKYEALGCLCKRAEPISEAALTSEVKR